MTWLKHTLGENSTMPNRLPYLQAWQEGYEDAKKENT